MMDAYYLIDFENVRDDGLNGCEKLSESDHIHLFYTDNANKINLDIVGGHGGAEFKLHKVPVGKQSLDMHLVTYLGYLIGMNADRECIYVIVSKDTDYDNIIKFWQSHSNVIISRSGKITGEAPKEKAKANASAKKSQPAAAKKNQPIAAKKSGDGSKLSNTVQQALSSEIQQTLSNADYEQGTVDEVTALVIRQYDAGKPQNSMLSNIHNDLRETYENQEEYLELYNLIKPVVARYNTPFSQKVELNSEIQQILSKAKMQSDVINYVASLVVKNCEEKNKKQVIYRSIISKYGQEKGLQVYNKIKSHI